MYKLLLCWRYLKTRYLALACVISVMLGVATLIVVNSVMSGFSEKLKDRMHGMNSDLAIESVSLDGFADPAAVRAVAPSKGVNPNIVNEQKQVVGPKDHDVIIHGLFEQCVEEKLVGPVFVHDYPAGLCPLTKRKRDNPAIAERFELYVHGMELANAYTELNDPVPQEKTFRQQLAGLPEEDSMDKMDDDFVEALRHGMPPAGGLGVGIDRLVMLLTNTTTIRDVILFPLLRPEKK